MYHICIYVFYVSLDIATLRCYTSIFDGFIFNHFIIPKSKNCLKRIKTNWELCTPHPSALLHDERLGELAKQCPTLEAQSQ